jgi:nucleoside-diphosphate-sugar epimerase
VSKPLTLLTGVTGFVGQALAQSFFQANRPIVAALRQLPNTSEPRSRCFSFVSNYQVVGSINGRTNWWDALQGVQTVVHCAARVHVRKEFAADALAAYRETNVKGTMRLAQQAADVGVRRFVFLSSIGVNGNQSSAPLTEFDVPKPHNPYAISKYEAENSLLALASRTSMEVVIIRPPLIYGPNAPGNFGTLLRWVQYNLPLPLGAIYNKRSLVALDNLVSLVMLCADLKLSPQAANQVFMVADGEDVSTTTLLRKVARAAGCSSNLLPVPPSLLHIFASILGKRAMADQLLGSLQIDSTKARSLLGWRPVVTMDEQLATIFFCK